MALVRQNVDVGGFSDLCGSQLQSLGGSKQVISQARPAYISVGPAPCLLIGQGALVATPLADDLCRRAGPHKRQLSRPVSGRGSCCHLFRSSLGWWLLPTQLGSQHFIYSKFFFPPQWFHAKSWKPRFFTVSAKIAFWVGPLSLGLSAGTTVHLYPTVCRDLAKGTVAQRRERYCTGCLLLAIVSSRSRKSWGKLMRSRPPQEEPKSFRSLQNFQLQK